MALLSVSTVSTRAQTTNWTGAISENWFIAGNWTAGVPTSATSAILSQVPVNPTVIAGPVPAVAQSLVLGQPFGLGNLTMQNGGSLTTATGAVIRNLPTAAAPLPPPA